MSKITTHVLNVAAGQPAGGISVKLEAQFDSGEWIAIGASTTDEDGRSSDLIKGEAEISPGSYRLRFDTREFFSRVGVESFYPEVVVTFTVKNATEHYHVPVLLSPFGYTTYRGS